MQNVKTHLVIGATDDGKGSRDVTVLYIGPDRHEARAVYLANKANLDYDFVGMDTLSGFKSRGRPKIDAETARAAQAAMARETEEEILRKSRIANAAKEALGEAALNAEIEEEEARAKLAALVAQSGASLVDDDEAEDDEEESEPVGKSRGRGKKKAEQPADDDASELLR